MQDITRGTQEKIHLNVFTDSILTQADDVPTVDIYDADNDTTPLSGFSGLATDEDEAGVYSYLLTPALTNIQRTIKVTWNYAINGIVFAENQYYRINSVYASLNDIIDFLSLGNEPSDINYQNPEKIVSAEKLARTIIDGYTGQKFSQYYGSQEQYGIGSDVVQLTERMLTLDRVWENDILVIDNISDPVYNTFGYGLEISPTGKAMRIVNQGYDVRYDNQVDPALIAFGRFRDGSRYKFEGQIGYKYVPEDIKIAAVLLVNDILSNDYNWRNKYLKKVDLSEISFEMAGGAFNGTGNIMVDNILDQYRNTNIVVI